MHPGARGLANDEQACPWGSTHYGVGPQWQVLLTVAASANLLQQIGQSDITLFLARCYKPPLITLATTLTITMTIDTTI
ncbi:MAG: hypothetical protein ACI9NT_002679 [Bacteroidia bacterium]|jgi:hypothetical protein